MSVQNFSSLAGLEVAEKFVVVGGWWVEHVTTMSNSNVSYIRVALSWVELSCVGFWQFGSQKNKVQIKFVSKKFWVWKNCGPWKFLETHKDLCPKKIGSQKICVPNNLGLERIWFTEN